MSSPDDSTCIGTLADGGQPDVSHLPIEPLIEQQARRASGSGGSALKLALEPQGPLDPPETEGSLLEITADDGGVGPEGSTRRSGSDNLSRRAERYGDRLSIDNQQEGGLRQLWAFPL
jgi:hypothetical protein